MYSVLQLPSNAHAQICVPTDYSRKIIQQQAYSNARMITPNIQNNER
jgi:hypothetical protein